MAKQQRVLSTHKRIYIYLLLIELSGNDKPVPSQRIYKAISEQLAYELAKSSFNRTARKLVEQKKLERYVNMKTRRIAFKLTDTSRKIAQESFKDLHKISIDDFLKLKDENQAA